ncbi:hypothetical protein [Kocuria sp. U4B]
MTDDARSDTPRSAQEDAPAASADWRAGVPDRSVLERALDAVTVRRVFGEAYELGGATVIPVARVRGGGGGGGAGEQSASGPQPGSSGGGSGLGFGVHAEPAGVYVVAGTTVSWQPAVDVGHLALTLGLAFFATAAAVGWAVTGRRP